MKALLMAPAKQCCKQSGIEACIQACQRFQVQKPLTHNKTALGLGCKPASGQAAAMNAVFTLLGEAGAEGGTGGTIET